MKLRMESRYRVLGIMSGTSLDGADLAYCEFACASKWSFRLLHSITVSYDETWRRRLSDIHRASAEDLIRCDYEYGTYLGELSKRFCTDHDLHPDLISSHGHTIFHQPARGFTLQIGSGASLAAAAGMDVACDFRSKDVALGGQGAPLVPIGDRLLFSGFDYCLNLGGIANISFEEEENRIAYDICVCNMVLNAIAARLDMPFDENGNLARKGKVNDELLSQLNRLKYFEKSFPKSLGREDVERDYYPLLFPYFNDLPGLLATVCEHIAVQVARSLRPGNRSRKLLVTGGGAFNTYLVERIQALCSIDVELPAPEIINYKEAIIFAFLGVLRLRNEINCLKSVTGARSDSCGGAIYAGE